jgi:hypothetical protein
MTAASLLSAVTAGAAFAEFEIQESTIDPGEIQLQYRGAWHSGLPSGGQVSDQDILPDDEEAPLRQSHEFEIQMSPTTYWLLALTHAFDEPIDGDLTLTAIEAESQFELITLEGDGFGFAIQGGVEKPVFKASQEPPDFHFGPILEVAQDEFLLTLNPLFFKELGHLAEQEGWGFEYGWQAKYEITERLSLALEMFGEIDDMSNAGPFDEQQHSIGPAFYYTIEAEKGDGITVPESRELTLSLGGQFGLTSQTSDFAVKVFIGYEYF